MLYFFTIMKKRYLFLMALLSGVLLSLSWPAHGFPFLLFVALVPLLYVEDFIAKNKHNFIKASVLFYSYVTFLIWNLLTTYWIYYSTGFGAVMAIVINSLFMAIVFHLYHLVRRTIFKSKGAFNVLIAFWICFEYLHLSWDLSWPWLNLGNGFANYPIFVQWYSFTGVFGGDIWILSANILLYKLLLSGFGMFRSRKRALLLGVGLGLWLVVPSALSIISYYTYHESENPYTCVVVQPNVDPFNEKFSSMSEEMQLQKMLSLARKEVDEKTDYLIFPETALPDGVVEDEINQNAHVDSLKAMIQQFPKLKIVIGISSYIYYKPHQQLSVTARYVKEGDYWYDVCNTAMYLSADASPVLYHKSKLVPGVEMMPFPRVLKPLEKYAIDLGGMTGSNATQETRTVFGTGNNNAKIAPVICYESIYGDFLTGYMRNGASLIFIITNDGWWENTPGYRQHFQYARLRAVENRRSIARAANTGTSGFINQRGDVLMSTEYWTPDVRKMTINANTHLTFYSRFGDYLGIIAMYVTIATLLLQITIILLTKRKRIIKAKRKT